MIGTGGSKLENRLLEGNQEKGKGRIIAALKGKILFGAKGTKRSAGKRGAPST